MKKNRLIQENQKLYRRYMKIKSRCYNPNNNSYKNYGDRGIKVCEQWLGENGFKNFLEWAFKNGYSPELQIDRIDNDKGYSPANCRWVDNKTNMSNRRNTLKVDGIPLVEIAIKMNIKYSTLASRYKKYGDIRIPKKKCIECREEFYPYRKNQKFCSGRCRSKNARRIKVYN